MAGAKDIVLRPITRQQADDVVKRFHYSHKVVKNSQVHVGVFLDGVIEGALQFGPSLDKRKIQGLVAGTAWNGFIELNRMAFSPKLPRNSESRAISVDLRMLRKHAPQIQWVVTFADAAQCGDGAIYRAAGFVLTGIKRNLNAWRNGDGRIVSMTTMTKGVHILNNGSASMRGLRANGFEPIGGFQLRYIVFMDPSARERLMVPVVPYSAIDEAGAGMYLGNPKRPKGHDSADQVEVGGSTPTRTLQE